MRVSSADGSPIGGETELLKEINASLRHDKDQPTVVQSIIALNVQMMQRLDTLVRQGGGEAAGPPPTGVKKPATGGGGDPEPTIQKLLKEVLEVAQKLERASVSLGGVGGAGGEGGEGARRRYHETETFLSSLSAADRVLKRWSGNIEEGTSLTKAFFSIMQQGSDNSMRGFITSILNVGGRLTNLGEAFSRAAHKIGADVADFRTNILGSNALNPGEFFFEFFTRWKAGMLDTSDSFRTALKTVETALSEGLMSPLAATGKSVRELSQDFMSARQNVRERGTEMLGLGTAAQTEKWFVNVVDTLQKYGIKSDINDHVTADRMTSMLGEMMKIRSNTGLSVDKLQDILKANQREQDLLVGSGRLDAREGVNRAAAMTAVESVYGKDQIKPLYDLMNKALAGGRPESGAGALYANDQKFWSMAETAVPGIMAQIQRMNQASMTGDVESMKRSIEQLGPMLRGYQETERNNPAGANALYKEVRPFLSGLSLLVNRMNTMGTPTADQAARGPTSEFGTIINRAMTTWEEKFKPMFNGLELPLAANTAALVLLTFRIGGLTAATTAAAAAGGVGGAASGLLGGLSRLLRVGGGLAAGAGLAYGAYQNVQDINKGQTSAGYGGLAGGGIGAIGGFLVGGPFGAMLGGVIGNQLGSWLGKTYGADSGEQAAQTSAAESTAASTQNAVQRQDASVSILGQLLGSSQAGTAYLGQIAGQGSMTGPGAPVAATMNQTAAAQESMINILSRILGNGETEVGYLSQIKAELSRQTSALTGQPSPAGAPPVGKGLEASNVSSLSSGRGDSSYPTTRPY